MLCTQLCTQLLQRSRASSVVFQHASQPRNWMQASWSLKPHGAEDWTVVYAKVDWYFENRYVWHWRPSLWRLVLLPEAPPKAPGHGGSIVISVERLLQATWSASDMTEVTLPGPNGGHCRLAFQDISVASSFLLQLERKRLANAKAQCDATAAEQSAASLHALQQCFAGRRSISLAQLLHAPRVHGSVMATAAVLSVGFFLGYIAAGSLARQTTCTVPHHRHYYRW